MKDEKIIELFFTRDEEAIKATEQKYGALCHHIAENFLCIHEDREECVSDAMLELWNSIPPARPDDLCAYLAEIVRCRAIDRTRANNAWKRGGKVQIVSDELLSTIPDGTELSESYESTRAGEIINELLSSLGREERAVFVMRYWMSESIREIASRTGSTEGKIKMMLMRTRKKLAERLGKEGFTL